MPRHMSPNHSSKRTAPPPLNSSVRGQRALTFALFENALVGMTVSHVWRGHGSALFLECGNLTQASRIRHDGSLGNPIGEITLMLQWSWRIEKQRSILGGSSSSEGKWPGMLARLKGNCITGLKVVGALPEIEVSLSNGSRVVTFMPAEGQPQWGIICRNKLKTLGVRRGKLHVEELAPN
jgi:hypothetical protein